MANDENTLKAEIADAIALLCEKTDSKYINVFDKSTLQDLARPTGRERYIFATGSYAFHEWHREDDVVLVFMSRASRSILWQLLEETLLLPSKPLANRSELEISAHNLSMTTTWQPSILAKFETLSRKNKGGCKFYLRYCQIPTGFDISTELLSPADKFIQSRSAQLFLTSDWNLCLVRDMQFIAGALQRNGPIDLSQPNLFHAMYNRVREWAQACGLYGMRFGFLNSECITWIVYKALWADGAFGEGRRIDQVDEDRKFRAMLEFFQSLMGSVDSEGKSRDELHIATPQGRIIGRYLTPDKLDAMASALRTTLATETALHLSYVSHLHMFLNPFEYYLKIEFSCWDPSSVQQVEFEDNCIPAIVQKIISHLRHKYYSEHNAAGLRIRLWPKPLAENEQEHQSTYAVGLGRSRLDPFSSTEPMAQYSSRIATQLSEIASTEPAPPASLITVTTATSEELMSIVQATEAEDTTRASAGPSHLARLAGGSTVATSRFRTAGEAINRLRHDPVHATVEYDLGYEDRFDGLVWMGLENWGSWATEEESFVAEHRVRVLKRRGDGVVVWDRENRVDRTGT